MLSRPKLVPEKSERQIKIKPQMFLGIAETPAEESFETEAYEYRKTSSSK